MYVVTPTLSVSAILIYSIMAFFIGLAVTPWFISFLRKNQFGKQLRVEAMDGNSASVFRHYHQSKHGTPTMGGLLIWGAIVLTIIISRVFSYFGVTDFSLLQRGQVYLPIFTLFSFGVLGALDDYLNILGVGKKKGLDALPKILTLTVLSFIGAIWFYHPSILGYNSIHVPFIGNFFVGIFYIPIFMFVIIGTSNAVNFTDGLDGLAGGLLIIAYAAFAVISYLSGLTILAGFCAVCVGAIAAFLWHNVPPALFFMGDTGSLSLGATLGVIALMIDQVLVLPLIGFIFVIETLSVIIQLTSKKLRGGKKVFLSAPIHHHFEALNWGESKVTMRFWIVGAMAAVIGVIIAISGS